METKKVESTIKVEGSKKSDWVITISDNLGFREDIAVTHEELLKLRDILNKKFAI